MNVPIPETLHRILADLHQNNRPAFLVGGCVRDAILGMPSKDIDVEVFNISYEELCDVLSHYGKINTVGRSFGVIKLFDMDFSLPRRDSKVDTLVTKGRGIVASTDSDIDFKTAASRRDFTINALMYDPITDELLDFFNGVEDLKHGVLRATSEAFAEDPLRVLRGMQLAARFNMTVDAETAKLCSTIKGSVLVKERVCEEWLKLFTKGQSISAAIKYLIDTEWIDCYPELKALHGLEQEPQHHPEGCAITHSALAADIASEYTSDHCIAIEDRVVLVAASLCHDMGKASTTQVIDGKITSYGHDKAGVEPTLSFLMSIGMKQSVIDRILPLVSEHMVHIMEGQVSVRSVRKLAHRLDPATIAELEVVLMCDQQSRPPKSGALTDRALQIISVAKSDDIYDRCPRSLIKGQDILNAYPNCPRNKLLGESLEVAFESYLNGGSNSKEDCTKVALKFLRNKTAIVTGVDLLEWGCVEGEVVGRLLKVFWEMQMKGDITSKEEARECFEIMQFVGAAR